MDFVIFDKKEEAKLILTSEGYDKATVISAKIKETLGQLSNLEMEIKLNLDTRFQVIEENLVGVKYANDGAFKFFVIKEVEYVDNPYNNTIKIYCEDYAIELIDSICRVEFQDTTQGVSQMITTVLRGTRWELDTHRVDNPTPIKFPESTKNKTTLEVLQLIAKVYGLNLAFDPWYFDKKMNNRYVVMKKELGVDNGVFFEYNHNLLSVERTVDSSSVKTAIIPIGGVPDGADKDAPPIDINKVVWRKPNNPTNKSAGVSWLVDEDATHLWGYTNSDGSKIPKYAFYQNDNIKDPNELAKEAWKELQSKNAPLVHYKFKVADLFAATGYDYSTKLSDLQINIGDIVTVLDKSYLIARKTKAHVLSREVDLLNVNSMQVEVGNITKSIVSTTSNLAGASGSSGNIVKMSSEISQLVNNINAVSGEVALIGTATIGTARIENGCITTAKIQDGSIVNAKIANLAVDNAKIQDGAINNAKIANASITNAKIVDGTIDSAKIEDATITSAKIQNGAIGEAQIEDASITNAKIDRASANRLIIENADIKDATIDTAKIATGSITTALIGTGAVDTAQIADGSITDAKIIGLTANKITAGTLDASEITVNNLNANNITAGTINGQRIADGAVDADKLSSTVNGNINKALSDSGTAKSSASSALTKANSAISSASSATSTANSALSKATSALTSADGKNTVLYSGSVPSTSNRKVGDTWFDTSDGYKMYRWLGSSWSASAFGTNAIENGAISRYKLADGSVTSAKVSYIDAGKITTGTLSANRIGSNSITTSKITAGAINSTLLATGAVTADKIHVGTITGDKIVNNAITSRTIASNTITANEIASNAVTTSELASNAVTASKISAGAITADKISVGNGDVSEGNLCLGKHFSSNASTADIERVTNGAKNVGSEYYSFGSGNGSNNASEGHYVQVDLGSRHRIGESRIYFYSHDSRFYYYKIKYSADGSHWYYAVGNNLTNGWVTSAPSNSGQPKSNPTINTFSIPITARYIRIYGNGNNNNGGNHIYEWELFSNQQTVIDGGQIKTGTITADKISAGLLTGNTLRTSSSSNYMYLRDQYIDFYRANKKTMSIGHKPVGSSEWTSFLHFYNGSGANVGGLGSATSGSLFATGDFSFTGSAQFDNNVRVQGSNIISYGHNANGSYIRYYDGTQICWKKTYVGDFHATNRSADNVYGGKSFACTFPIAFASNDVSVSVSASSNGFINSCHTGATTTALQVRLWSNYSTNQTYLYYYYTAIGRWK